MPDPLISLLVGLFISVLVLALFWPDRGLFFRLQRMRRMTSRVLLEDALKHILNSELNGKQITPQSVAGVLQISANKAATLLAEMENHEFLTLQSGEIQLTPAGREYALRIVRAHRLWERYLADETGFNESEWHHLAERYEHLLSQDDAHALDRRLGHPTYDPHGDPIPTAEGELMPHSSQPITAIKIGEVVRIVHIEDEPDEVYAQLVAEGLYPGMNVRLIDKSPQRICFFGGNDEHVLAPIVAANISVIPIFEEAQEDESMWEQLSAIKLGQKGKVVNISPRCRGAERRRLLDLGVLPGTVVEADLTSPSGDPTAYRIRDAVIALRKEQASLINVVRLQEDI